MNAKLIELAEYRKSLVARAATQRAELSRLLTPWRQGWAVMDLGWGAVRFIRSYGPLLAGIATFVAPFGSGRMGKWVRRGLMAWSMARVVMRILPG